MVRVIFVITLFLLVLIRVSQLREFMRTYKAGDTVELNFVANNISYYSNETRIKFHNIQISIPKNSQINVGDKVKIIGKLEARLIGKDNTQLRLINGRDLQISQQISLIGTTAKLRHFLVEKINKYLPSPEAGLASGVLLGGSGEISSKYQQIYRQVGLTHVVAASGYNLTLVVGWIVPFFVKFLSRRKALLMAILSLIVYMGMAGMTASVVRSGIMVVLVLVGQILGRPTQARWILILTAAVMIIFNPEYVFDIGFQLSLASTAGLLWFSPSSSWWTTIAAQVATMPLILHHFGTLSLVAPVTNILVVWSVGPVMQIMAAAVVMGTIFEPAGRLIAYMAYPLLKYFNESSLWFSNLPWASVQVNPVSWLWVGAYYVLLVLIYLLWFRKIRSNEI